MRSIAVVGTTLAALRGKVAGANSLADRWGMVAMMALDIQMLLGLLLYFVAQPEHEGDPATTSATR